jgi:acyl-coenzyme A thioesterase PaaI-like protein
LTGIQLTQPPAGPAGLARDGWLSADVAGFIELVGPILMRAEGERTRFGFLAQPKHENLRGVVQGGMIATFCDRALGLSAMNTQSAASMATIELAIRYIDAVRIGDFVELVPEVLRATRSLVFMRGTVLVDTRVIASVDGIWKVLGSR